MSTQSISSVTCPYCQTELSGDFHPGDLIECESCKGRFQPPPDLLKEIIVSREICPFCKTTFNAPSLSTSLIECPSCNGKFSRGPIALYAIVPRPEVVRLATILLTTSILVGSILYVILLTIGRTSGNWQLMNTAVSRSIATLPWKLLTVLFAWMLFKGRNWARGLFNLVIPLGILFALMQAIERHAVNIADKLHANYLAETIFWINLFASTFLGIGALCYINSTESRNWFHLPKERKTSTDYPWWIIVLLIVILCPVLLFAKALYSPNIKNRIADSPLESQHAAVEQLVGPISSSSNGSEWEKHMAHSDAKERKTTNHSTAVESQGNQQRQTSSGVEQRQAVSTANTSSANSTATAGNSEQAAAARTSNEPPSPGDRVELTVRGVKVAFRYCPSTESELWKKFSGAKENWIYIGSPDSEAGRFPDEDHYLCKLSAFWIMETEVTQELWKSVMGNNPSTRKSGDQYPVESVSWNDCQDFLQELNDNSPINGFVWRLPTEAQWEFACRAGTETALPNGKEIVILDVYNAPALNDIAWYGGNSSVDYHGVNGKDTSEWSGKQYPGGVAGTHPVASKRPNRWGIYDMIGNVAEWCSDRYGEKRNDHLYYRLDPTGPSSGNKRIFRGGAWDSRARYCRSAWRGDGEPDKKYNDLGLRVILVPVR